MNKYIKYLLNKEVVSFVSSKGPETSYLYEDNSNIILQLVKNENYHIEGYKIIFSSPAIYYITYQNEKYTHINDVISIDYKFKSDNQKLLISFKDNLADNYALPIKVVLADKEKWDKNNKNKETNAKYKNGVLVVNPGIDFLNIFWKNVKGTNRREIKVYYQDTNKEDGSIIEYKIYDGSGQKSDLNFDYTLEFFELLNLAPGKYKIILIQYKYKYDIYGSTVTILSQTETIVEIKSLVNEIGKVKNAFYR